MPCCGQPGEEPKPDLATVHLGRSFDAVVMAGNVMIFLAPGSEAAAVSNMARHLQPEGLLIAGFQIMPGHLTVTQYDELAGRAGLALAGPSVDAEPRGFSGRD